MSNDPNSDRLKSDLMYAILAMDSYNRGYGSGIEGLDDSQSLGMFTVRAEASTELGATEVFNAGFYAIAYRNTANEVVISYRGTDFNGNWPSLGDVSRASCTHHSSS